MILIILRKDLRENLDLFRTGQICKVSFVVAPNTVALSRNKPASAETSRDSGDDFISDNRNALYGTYFT
jgi:hypothetical protein